jgi:hypothetical protein
MSYQPPSNVDPPAQPANPSAKEGRWAGEQETSYRLGIAGQVCGYVSLGLFAGPYLIAVLFNLSPDIGRFLPTVGAFVGLPLSVVGIVLSVLGLRSLFDKKPAMIGLILCFIAFLLTLVFVLAALLSPK